MKKLLVLSVLLGLLALPMFASDITFGGDLTYGFIGDFGDDFNETQTVTTDIKADVGDYNSLVIEMDWWDVTNTPDKAVVTTDLGMWLGLPIGLTANWGFDDPDRNEFHAVSAYGNEDRIDFSPSADYWGHQFLITASFVEVEVAFDPGLASASAGRLLAGLAVKEPIAGLNAEVYYFQGGAVDAFDEGWIAVDAGYAGEFGALALEVGAGLAYPLLDTNDMTFSAGVSAEISMATITVGYDGNATDALNELTASAVIAPIDMLDIYAGMAYDGAGSELAEIDLGINAHIGAAELYVGYLVDGDSLTGAGDRFKAPPGLASGENGAYIKFDIDY